MLEENEQGDNLLNRLLDDDDTLEIPVLPEIMQKMKVQIKDHIDISSVHSEGCQKKQNLHFKQQTKIDVTIIYYV